MIHVGLAHGIVAAFDVAVVGGEVERPPAAFVGDVGIGAVIEQIGGQLVVPVLGGGEQRGPAVVGDLIDVGAGVDQNLGALEAILRGPRTPAGSGRRHRCRCRVRRKPPQRRHPGLATSTSPSLPAAAACSSQRLGHDRPPRPPRPAATWRLGPRLPVRPRKLASASRHRRAPLRSALLAQAASGLRRIPARGHATEPGTRWAPLVSWIGSRLDVRAGRDQSLTASGWPARRPTSERVVPRSFSLRVDIGLVVEQNLDRVQVAVARGEHQRRFLLRIALVGVGAGLEQLVDHRSRCR